MNHEEKLVEIRKQINVVTNLRTQTTKIANIHHQPSRPNMSNIIPPPPSSEESSFRFATLKSISEDVQSDRMDKE